MLTGAHLVFAAMIAASAESASAPILRVGGVIENRPWEFRDENNQTVGFEVDLAHRIGDRLGMRVEFIDLPLRDLFAAVDEQRVDVAMNAITVTDERMKRFALTQPYYDFSRGLVVQKKSGLRGLGDMARKVVGVQSGSDNEVWVSANKARYGFAEVKRFTVTEEGLESLTSHDIDGYVADLPYLFYMVRNRPDLTVVTRIPTPDRFSAVLRKNSPLVKKVDDVITELKQDGTLAQIHHDWFGLMPDKSSATVRVLPRP